MTRGDLDFLPLDDNLLAYESKKWAEGVLCVIGVDEVGRGPLAGPVVAAAVSFPKGAKIPLVDDSKKLTEKKRDVLYERILAVPGVRYGVVEVSPEEIDEVNILKATHLAMDRASRMIEEAEFALIDGLPVPGYYLPSEAIVKGDSKSASIAAASILAKVYRDRLMVDFAKQYPEYGFERHKGYGTKVHLEALKEHGPCPIHRMSFAPVRNAVQPPPEQQMFNL